MTKKILVTEDDPSLQEIFKIILENAGYEVEVKASGNAIMDNTYTKPDLFLLDKQLSGMDGIDLCIHLKEQANTKDIPVVMISANPGIAQLSKEAGADAFVEKPFERSHLLQVIKDCIG
jgi:CheY-like chemotaxis protein